MKLLSWQFGGRVPPPFITRVSHLISQFSAFVLDWLGLDLSGLSCVLLLFAERFRSELSLLLTHLSLSCCSLRMETSFTLDTDFVNEVLVDEHVMVHLGSEWACS